MKSLNKIWWSSLVIKLILSAIFPLSQDEAYYWVWSKHLQLSYFDHPAMVSWLFWLGQIFEHLGQAVRWPSVILGHLTLLLWILILEKIVPANEQKQKNRFWIWLALSSPMLGFGSLISTPDVPVVFFWTLSAFFLGRVLEKQALKDYFLLGAALGLGFCSKYHIVLFVLSILCWLLIEKKWKIFSAKGLALTIFSGLIFSSPVFIWNYQNNFQSFRFQLEHGLGAHEWESFWTYSYCIAQIVLLGPVTIWFAWKAVLPRNFSYIRFLAWVPLIFFIFSSFKGTVEVNWPIVAYPAIYFLAVIGATKIKQLWWTILPWSILALFVVAQTLFPFTNALPERLVEIHYFDPITETAKSVSPLYFGSYQMASKFWYEFKVPTKKLFQINRHDLFDEMQGRPPKENHFFVVKESWVPWPSWLTEESYAISKIRDIPPKFDFYEVTKK